jgi:hypothetical protein
MSDKIEIKFFVALNEDGEYGISTDKDSVCDDLSPGATRIVKCVMLMTAPKPTEVEIGMPDEMSDKPSVTINA